MIRDLIKWVAPGLATVLCGTTLCLAMTSAEIGTDLTARSSAALAAGGYDWAELSLDTRDIQLSGTTTDQASLDAAIARLSAVEGVRSVTADVTLAPLARPYFLEASVDQGIVALSGGVPNASVRQHLLSLAGLEQGALDLRSGVPNARSWLAGAEFAISQLQYLDQGKATISDLTVSLDGRARSERAFRDLLIVQRAGPPAGVTLGEVNVAPALVSPYRWNASFDGKRIDVSGYVPDEALVERLRTADVSGAQVATGLALGSGEPVGFADLSQLLLRQLSRLEYGSASIVDGESALSGAPATVEIAQAVVEALQPSGSIVVLEPPRIEDYWMSATRQAGGVIVFDGYAPDEATREGFAQRDSADTTYLKLGRGAPERYHSGADFGLQALDLMSEGRISLRGNELSISGTTRTGADYDALLALLASQAPQGTVLASAEISAPRADSYSWTLTKNVSGEVALSGLVPNPDDKARLLAAAGSSATETMTYASGEPNGFVAAAETAIGLAQWLREGSLVYDGLGWTVTGTANSTIDRAALEADFVTRKLAAEGWSMAVAEPPAVVPQPDPYIWSAMRAAQGVTLMGHIPSESVRSELAELAGHAVVDSTSLALGAPDGFEQSAVAGLTAIQSLSEGEVSFDGASWSLSGHAESEAERADVLAALSAATNTVAWTIAITAPEPEPVATVPYVWSAIKSADGAVTLTGLVPAEALQRLLAVRAGNKVDDQTAVDATAPQGFADDALAALSALSVLADGVVNFDGSAWTISGSLPNSDASAAVSSAIATAATPAESWTISLVEPAAPEPAANAVAAEPEDVSESVAALAEPVPVDPNYAFSATRSNGSTVMSGQLPSDQAMRYFAAISSGDTAAITIAQGAPEGFLSSAEAGLRALLQLSEGQLDFAGGAWSLRGVAPDETVRDAVLAATVSDGGATNWNSQIDLPPPPPAPVEPVAASVPAAPRQVADISVCSAPVSEISARNSILFQSGAALIAAESEAALDELALALASCPDAVVHIEGHTDADGDESLNMALSVARAEAVVNALISRGTAPSRLYAVGYGESAPIADNGTAQGKRLNRRIVVLVQPEHY